jgi:hypothetical protein
MSDPESLVLALPRRELYAVRGFTDQITVLVLESLQQEAWFATAAAVAADIDAKEVHIGLLVRREQQWLVESSGVLLHSAPVYEAVARFGYGLGAMKRLAESAGAELMGTTRVSIELRGLLNEDRLEETRPFLVLVYVLSVDASVAAPTDMVWVTRSHLADLSLDPASSLVVDFCRSLG